MKETSTESDLNTKSQLWSVLKEERDVESPCL